MINLHLKIKWKKKWKIIQNRNGMHENEKNK
jgi:hypothetical protein